MRAVFVFLSCCALAASTAGCKSVPEYMREVNPVRQLKAPADRALVVFVRTSNDRAELPAHVMDDSLTFLGSALPGTHFSVVRPPGKQQFIVFSGDAADAVVADLYPGLVYFIELTPATAPGPARFTFKTSARGTNIFPYKEEWVDDTSQFRVDPFESSRQMGPETNKRHEKVVKDANERLGKYKGVDLTEHTLLLTDGHAKVGVPGTVRYAAPVPVYAAPPPRSAATSPAWTPAPAPMVPAPAPTPPPMPMAAPTADRGPAPLSLGFTPEDYPNPAPGPAPEFIPQPEEIKRGYMKGTMVRVNLKNGTVWLGEVVNETRVDLKISVGGRTHLLDFADMASIDELSKGN